MLAVSALSRDQEPHFESIKTFETEVLLRQWRSALKNGETLPAYEDDTIFTSTDEGMLALAAVRDGGESRSIFRSSP